MTRHFSLALLAALLITMIIGCSTFTPVKHDVVFKKDTCIKPYQDYTYKLCEPVEVRIDGEKIIIPRQFITDLASVPRPFWTFISPNQSNLIAPAILHDYLYSCHKDYDRIDVDEIFYNALVENNVSTFRSYLFYVGVRMFGYPHYHTEISCDDPPMALADSDSDDYGNFLECDDNFDGDI